MKVEKRVINLLSNLRDFLLFFIGPIILAGASIAVSAAYTQIVPIKSPKDFLIATLVFALIILSTINTVRVILEEYVTKENTKRAMTNEEQNSVRV